MKVGIGIPIIDSVPGESYDTHLGLVRDMARHPETSDLKIIRSLNIFGYERARNMIMEKALGLELDMLVMVDTDIVVPVKAYGMLFDCMRVLNAALVSGHTFQKGGEFQTTWCETVQGKMRPANITEDMGPQEISSCGFGLVLIDMNWIRMIVTTPCLGKPIFRWVKMPDGGEMGEDCYLCNCLHAIGGLVIGHPGVRCGHLRPREEVNDDNVEILRKLHPQTTV